MIVFPRIYLAISISSIIQQLHPQNSLLCKCELCTGLGTSAGNWQKLQNSLSENFFCCDGKDKPYASTICQISTIPEILENGCTCLRNYYEKNKGNFSAETYVSEAANYEWIPSNCELLQWDERLFCELLGQNRILMVGDSTMVSLLKCLMNLIRRDGVWDFK